jgi:hypothetical protein
MRVQSYLLCETVRQIEEAADAPHPDPDHDLRASAPGLTSQERIAARAERVAAELGLDAAVRRTGERIRFVALAGVILCFIVGLGATHALPEGYPARANVISLLVLLLVPNLLSLLIWLALTVSAGRGGHSSAYGWLGARIVGIYAFLEDLLHAGGPTRAAGRAWRDFLTGTATGRKRLTLLSHCCWMAAIMGALTGCWWLLVVQQVDFVWGSTLLTANDIQSLLGTIMEWVSAFGFSVPSPDDIGASRIDVPYYDAALRRRWGVFLLGAMITLALLPRLIALLVDAVGCVLAGRHLQLNLIHPGYARLPAMIMPLSPARATTDPGAVAGPAPEPALAIAAINTDIPDNAAWLALEHPTDAAVPGRTAIKFELGVLDSQAAMTRVAERLAAPAPAWEAVCVMADLAITPDRGIARQLRQLIAASRRPMHLVLYASPKAAALPAGDLQARQADWTALAARAGLPAGRSHRYER